MFARYCSIPGAQGAVPGKGAFPKAGGRLQRTARAAAVLVLLWWIGEALPARAQHYQIQWLGFLPGGNSSEPLAISHDGSTVVGRAKLSTTSDAEWAIFRWTASTGMVRIDGLDGLERTNVSADGSAIAGTARLSGQGYRAARWIAGGVQILGTLGGDEAFGTAISADGTTVVGMSGHAFRWTASTGMQDLGSLGGGESEAYAVSANGNVVVGTSRTSNNFYHAFVWTPSGGMQDLGGLGGIWNTATDVSDDGSVVVGLSRIADGTTRAFRWTASGGMEQLNTPGRVGSRFIRISPDGSTIILRGPKLLR